MPEPLLDLAKALISRPSISPHDEGCQVMLAERLSAIGFSVEHMPFGEVSNLWARYGTESPLICFAGHTDVVPTDNESLWKNPPFKPIINDGMLHGRGAADMKGSLAAMITGCELFIQNNPDFKGSIAFLITSDEEADAVDGTRRVIETLNARNEKIDYCIVGEPSSTSLVGDVIRNGRRGSLNGSLTVHGKEGHVAYPDLALNPVHAFLPALTELSQTTWDEGNEYFPATSFQISNIQAGTGATNVIPGKLDVLFNFRFSSARTAEELQTKTEAIFQKYFQDYSINWHLSGNPFLTEVGTLTNAVSESILEITGTNTTLSTGGGTSDGRFIAPSGAQVVELGPCNATIHKINECVSVADLETLESIYGLILQKLLD